VEGSSAAVGTAVHMGDALQTGPNGRLEVTFVDDTRLTLGDNAKVVIDRYVHNPGRSVGEVALKSAQGALRFTTGKNGQMSKKGCHGVDPSCRPRSARHGFLGGAHRWPIRSPTSERKSQSERTLIGTVTLTRSGQRTKIDLAANAQKESEMTDAAGDARSCIFLVSRRGISCPLANEFRPTIVGKQQRELRLQRAPPSLHR